MSDFDLGWQMATGRWIVQHRAVPSTDVLSYTAAGKPWTYPVASGVIFYLAYLLGGYSLISWIGASACAGTVALLLRRGAAVTAAMAILAVPLIAVRTTPRADMFTVVLFAAFLSILWEHHGAGGARLWPLPLLMVVWVNLHLGFIAGLALTFAYVLVELLDAAVNPAGRTAALGKLRNAAGWLALVAVATLANPWGWGVYRAILLQERVTAQHEYLIKEWARVPLSWTAISSSFSLRQTNSTIYVLLGLAVIAAVQAFWRAQIGTALLLLSAAYVGIRYARMGALFACVVVVVAGPGLSYAVSEFAGKIRPARVRTALASAGVALFAVLAVIRCYDLVTNRFYLRSSSKSTFGAGLGWWFPQRATEFIQDQNLPGEVFNSYDEGGYVAWKLGPERLDMIDGRAIPFGVEHITRDKKLQKSPPDSAMWREEIGRYNLNTILLSLARFDGIEFINLPDFCNNALWQPVYLDEVSAVFVRRTPQTEDLRQRFAVNCATAPLPAQPPGDSGASPFNSWSNSAAVLAALGRSSDALSAIDRAIEIFPDSGFAHWLRGGLLAALGRPDESQQEFLTAVALDPRDVTWSALSESYRSRGRNVEAIDAMNRAVALSPRPDLLRLNLGYLYLKTNHPQDALRTFDLAQASAPSNAPATDGGTFDFMVAQGRSAAWEQLGDLSQAILFQEQAAEIEPNSPGPWRRLAELYGRQGRSEDATRAEQRAAAQQKSSQ